MPYIVSSSLTPAGQTNNSIDYRPIGVIVDVTPRINPDGAERFLKAPVLREYDGNALPIDDDRDGVADDDPADDLNGDGLITMMRVPGGDKATHLADADEPRLSAKADRAADERPAFRLMVEGIDNDGDGEYNEDGIGGVLPNRNFPHGYPELKTGAGAHELSEPGTLALVDFVLAHPNVSAVIVYGRHDNLVTVPKGKERDVSGRGYRHLHPDDVATYEHVSEKYKELTGLDGAAESDNAGAFYAWAYNQRGLPTFATSLWWLDKEENKDKKDGDKKDKSATTQPADEDKTPAAETKPATTKPDDKSGKKGDKKKKDTLKLERRWLKYSDEKRAGEGFVAWEVYDHPTLGEVEIGGFVPGFQVNPPADAIAGIVEKQQAFVADVAGRLPRPKVAGCKITKRSDGVFEIELSMTNDAYLPTALAMARTARLAHPFVLRLGIPAERVLGGLRMQRISSIGGLGAVEKVRWLVSGKAGEEIGVEIYNKQFGTTSYKVVLEE